MISMLWYTWLNESIIYILKVEKVDLPPASVFGGSVNNRRSHPSLSGTSPIHELSWVEEHLDSTFLTCARQQWALPTIYSDACQTLKILPAISLKAQYFDYTGVVVDNFSSRTIKYYPFIFFLLSLLCLFVIFSTIFFPAAFATAMPSLPLIIQQEHIKCENNKNPKNTIKINISNLKVIFGIVISIIYTYFIDNNFLL